MAVVVEAEASGSPPASHGSNQPARSAPAVQGRLVKAAGTVFLHVELSRTVREGDLPRASVVRALAAAKINRP